MHKSSFFVKAQAISEKNNVWQHDFYGWVLIIFSIQRRYFGVPSFPVNLRQIKGNCVISKKNEVQVHYVNHGSLAQGKMWTKKDTKKYEPIKWWFTFFSCSSFPHEPVNHGSQNGLASKTRLKIQNFW